MRLQFIIPAVLCMIILSCKNEKDLDRMTEGLCDCAQPIIEWRAGLQKDPSTLSKGNAIKMEVDSCLDIYHDLYVKHAYDTGFINKLKEKIASECQPAFGSVNAMLQMLSEK